MATHIKLPRKIFDYINEHPATISVPAIGITSTGLIINTRKQNKNLELQGKQLEAMNRLTDSLNKVDKTVRKSFVEENASNKKQKPESILANIFKKQKRNDGRRK